MNTLSTLTFGSHANVFSQNLSMDTLRERVPAVFAESPDERLSGKYTFIPSGRVLSGLISAGFVPVDGRQTHNRKSSFLHARHVLRMRRRFETVALRDSVPEIVFLNSHDGTSAYQLRLGLFPVICTNGLIVSRGAFPTYCVAHRGNVVDDVVAGALAMAERFEVLATQVERMERRVMERGEQIEFATQALALRYPDRATQGMLPVQLLTSRRPQDLGDDLWSVLNKVQENLIGGGVQRRSPTGRLLRTRRITSIREDVRLNSRLWDMAYEVMAS
jgi:Domain of unknown function (DUF932)